MNNQPMTATAAYSVDVSRGELRGDVSRQWFCRPDDERFTSLADLERATRERYQASATQVIDNRDLEFIAPEVKTIGDTQKLSAGLPGGREVGFSHWSFGQAAGLAGAPAGYLRTLPSQIAADALSWGMRRNRSVEQTKAYYTAENGGQLRALTGPTYGRIADYEVVQAVRTIAGDGDGSMGWKVPGMIDWGSMKHNPFVEVTKENTTLYASDRDVFIFLVDDLHPIEVGKLPNGDPDLMFRGFFTWNSEVGKSTFGLAAFYLRGVCMNRNLWGVEGFNEFKVRHSSGAPDRFMYEARPALQSFANGSEKRLIDGVNAAKARIEAADDDAAVDFLKGRGFSRKRIGEIIETAEREEERKPRSTWDFAQAISAVARKEPNQDSRIDLEREAGKLLNRIA